MLEQAKKGHLVAVAWLASVYTRNCVIQTSNFIEEFFFEGGGHIASIFKLEK